MCGGGSGGGGSGGSGGGDSDFSEAFDRFMTGLSIGFDIDISDSPNYAPHFKLVENKALGLGLELHTYQNLHTSRTKSAVIDTLKSPGCWGPGYPPLAEAHFDADQEKRLKDNYPQFSKEIERLIEDRRSAYHRQHRRCDIL